MRYANCGRQAKARGTTAHCTSSSSNYVLNLLYADAKTAVRGSTSDQIARRRSERRHSQLTKDRIKLSSSASTSDSLYNTQTPTETRQKLFGDIAPVYDEINEKLSLGQHKVWKKMAVKWANAKPKSRCLDTCCGSGDLAFLLAERAGHTGRVVAIDFSQQMLQHAEQRERSWRKPRSKAAGIEWQLADATDLPFEDNSFDAATMGYGLRNVADKEKALRELSRVLRPGGKVSILDFNNASRTNPIADAFQGWALENIVVPTAKSFGLEEEYRYVRPSIQAFPTGREQERLARQNGFREAVHYEIAFGLMGILVSTV